MTLGQESGFGSPLVLVLMGAALSGLIAFMLVERRIAQPMIDFSLFRNFLFDLNLAMGLLVSTVLSGLFILPYYLELVRHYPTFVVGVLMMVDPLGMAVMAPISGALSDRFGSRITSILGLSVVCLGCFTLSLLNVGTDQVGFILHMMPIGIGMGLFMSPNNSAIMGAVPRERLGITSGLLTLTRLLGNSTGLPLMGALFSGYALAAANLPTGTDVTSAAPAAVVAGTQSAFHAAAAGVGIAIAIAVIAFIVDSRRKKTAMLVETAAVEEQL
jgi:MFS family permease